MPRPPRPSPRFVHELWHPRRSEPGVQSPEVSIKGKRNEASGVWRHSHVAPLRGVKSAQVTTLCQNGSRLWWLCQSQVKAGICSQEDGGSHPFFCCCSCGKLRGPLKSWILCQGPQCSSMSGKSSAPLYRPVESKEQPPWTLGHH